jgi:hypothetical protein
MCGEIQIWQKAMQVTVRVTSGAWTEIVLNKTLEDVEEIRLDEIMITGFNSATSASCYVNLEANNLANGYINNENKRGLLVPIDVLNPHTFYSRPRLLATSEGVNLNRFGLTITMPNGTAATLTEASLVLTFVMHKPKEEIRAYREKMAMMEVPSIKDVARNAYQPK